ncbi:hypothetical protein COY87_02005 [Candidatus Roizmanbacteria bacterium CG_4_10_14_0_8_um_filter_33_9]|uniref:ECF transporter S component n=1 Tax=Candidatus Roizmanbacteria bacterium CG_4_10_14_0_8_um_filter_33_9 TaxID=1974826 RepID=A0A2M7QJV4_9BACT|nr:MAG: hypothetical protein COY87_02005 [Candidatus Roizmanbacteria bacterium CG_4_10_14_0_8_um_filter_33_9]
MDYKKILIKSKAYLPSVIAILFVSLTRLLPHPPNVSPVTAIALFAGSTIGGISAFSIPLLIMFISDMFLGFHITIPFVYASFILITLLGFLLKKRNRFQYYFIASLISSLLFFLITNFGVWLTSSMYQKSVNGLILCYTMGIPFFRNTIVGDIIYTIGIFYGFKLLTKIVQRVKLSMFLK